MDNIFYTLYTYSIAYLLSIFLSVSRIPFVDKYNIEYLINYVYNFAKNIFAQLEENKERLFFILTSVATIAFFFLSVLLLSILLKFVNMYIVMAFEVLLLYFLISLRTASDKIIVVYYSLLKYAEDEIKTEIDILLKDPDMHGVVVNTDGYDHEDVIALTTEIMAKYILEKGNIIIMAFIFGVPFAIAYKAFAMLFGTPLNRRRYSKVYRAVTIAASYINCASLMLTLIILRMDYQNAFKAFRESRNVLTAFGYNEALSVIAGGLDISIGTPPADEGSDELPMIGDSDDHDEFAMEERLVGDTNKYLEVNDIKSVINIYYTNSVILFGLGMGFRLIVYLIMQS